MYFLRRAVWFCRPTTAHGLVDVRLRRSPSRFAPFSYFAVYCVVAQTRRHLRRLHTRRKEERHLMVWRSWTRGRSPAAKSVEICAVQLLRRVLCRGANSQALAASSHTTKRRETPYGVSLLFGGREWTRTIDLLRVNKLRRFTTPLVPEGGALTSLKLYFLVFLDLRKRLPKHRCERLCLPMLSCVE